MKQLINVVINFVKNLAIEYLPSKELYKKRVFKTDIEAIRFFNKKYPKYCTYMNWVDYYNHTYSVEWCSFRRLAGK